jgi:hypothetical protein
MDLVIFHANHIVWLSRCHSNPHDFFAGFFCFIISSVALFPSHLPAENATYIETTGRAGILNTSGYKPNGFPLIQKVVEFLVVSE